jgi:excisionase family DNA binding protein
LKEALLDIQEAALFLGVSTTSLRRWTNSGRLACVRVGVRGDRRFRFADLVAFLEEQPTHALEGTPAKHVSVGGMNLLYGTHLCGFYSTDEARARLAATFLAGGSVPGSVSYLVAEPAAQRSILARLAKEQTTLKKDIAGGRLAIFDHAATGRQQLKNFKRRCVADTAGGAHSLRLVGDVWGLAKKITRDELVEFEEGYDQVIARRFPVVTLCLYDVRRFSTLDALRALRGHGDGFRYPVERWLA